MSHLWNTSTSLDMDINGLPKYLELYSKVSFHYKRVILSLKINININYFDDWPSWSQPKRLFYSPEQYSKICFFNRKDIFFPANIHFSFFIWPSLFFSDCQCFDICVIILDFNLLFIRIVFCHLIESLLKKNSLWFQTWVLSSLLLAWHCCTAKMMTSMTLFLTTLSMVSTLSTDTYSFLISHRLQMSAFPLPWYLELVKDMVLSACIGICRLDVCR